MKRKGFAGQGMKKSGVTMIELLVVIAIIAMLAAILLPALSTAKEKTRRAICMSNMKQIGILLLMFASDHQEEFPSVDKNEDYWVFKPKEKEWKDKNPSKKYTYHLELGITKSTQEQLAPYLEQYRIFYCPSERAIASSYWQTPVIHPSDPDEKPNYIRIGYTYLAGIPFDSNSKKYVAMTTADVDITKQTLIVDRMLVLPSGIWDSEHINHRTKSLNGEIVPAGANHLFGDGRVAWVNANIMTDLVISYNGVNDYRQIIMFED